MTKRLSLVFTFVAVCLTQVLAPARGGVAQPPTAPATCNNFYHGGHAPTVARSGPSGRTFCHMIYSVSYSTSLRNPIWTAQRLTKADAEAGDRFTRRNRRFRQQPGLTAAEQGSHGDYEEPYDRGHMAPADDAPDPTSQADTFFVSNVVPQDGALNGQLWARLESSVNRLAELQGEVFIVTGPIFGPNPRLMGGRIAIPDFTFKAIFVPRLNVAVAFVAGNSAPFACEVISIAELTRRSGIDPFPALPASAKANEPAFTLPPGQRLSQGRPVRVSPPNCV